MLRLLQVLALAGLIIAVVLIGQWEIHHQERLVVMQEEKKETQAQEKEKADEKLVAVRVVRDVPRPDPVKQPEPIEKPKEKPEQYADSKVQAISAEQAPAVSAIGQGSPSGSSTGYNLVGSFDCPVSFYLEKMRSAGAMIVVYEQGKRQFYELTADNAILPLRSLSGNFSTASRRLTREYPDSVAILTRTEKSWGPGHYEILMLLPQELEQRIRKFVDQAVAAQGVSDPLSAVHVRYRQQGNVLKIVLDRYVASAGGGSLSGSFQI